MNNSIINTTNEPITHPQVPETPHPTEPEGAPDQPQTDPYPVTDPPLTPDTEPYPNPDPIAPFPAPRPGGTPDVLVQ